MKIVIAPDSYKESLSALEAATAMELGFKTVFPEATIIKVPMADGGEGTVQSLIDATDGQLIETEVTAPLGNKVTGFYGITGDKKTAIIEMAAASGLHLVSPDQRDPFITTSYGTGDLVKAALDQGVSKIILGIGGSATNDAGLGMAQALGIQFFDHNDAEFTFGNKGLKELERIDISRIDPRLANVEIEVACDVDNPLCGPTGASYVFGPQKGAKAEDLPELDNNLARFADIILAQFDLNVKDMAGSGAAGGLGACLSALFNAKLKPGIDIVIDASNLENKLADADLVVTGEGRIDSQSIHGKTPIGVARCAKKYNIPVIGIAGSISEDCNIVHSHGIDSVFSATPRAMALQDAFTEAAVNIELTAVNIAQLIKVSNPISVK